MISVINYKTKNKSKALTAALSGSGMVMALYIIQRIGAH